MPNDKELRALNLFFGIIIVFFSIYILMSYLINNANAQITIISICLLIVGVAFTTISFPNKEKQDKEDRIIEIFFGYIVTFIGLIFFFIALISNDSMIQILLFIIVIIFGIVGGAVIFAIISEHWTASKYLMGIVGIIMIILSVVNFMMFLLGPQLDINFIDVIIILLFISLLIHGLSRILVSRTGIYK